jgi:flagellar motor protein MotB
MAIWEERESDLEAELNRGALWAVTYGDLMSYLTIFFMLLYAAVVSRSVSMQMGLKGVEEEFGKEGDVVRELFSRHGIQRIAKLEVGEDRMRIMFLAPVLFESGRAELRPSSLPDLKRLADVLSEMPNPIQIEGHTDDQPLGRGAPFKSNWELSSARAFAVLRQFERSGVPSNRLSAIGYGEFRPLKANDTPEGRSANRRIEVNLMRRKA